MSALAAFIAVAAAALGALCAAADAALLSLASDPRTADAETASFVRGRERTHRALGVARVLAYVTAGAAAAAALQLRAQSVFIAVPLAIVVCVVLLISAETAPRALGSRAGISALRILKPAVQVVEVALSPVVALGLSFDEFLERLFPPARTTNGERGYGGGRLRDLVQDETATPIEHTGPVRRVFDLRDTEVQEIMVPRVDIVGIQRDMSWSEVIERVRSSEHARLPVYEETLDDIVGVVYAKDLLPYVIVDAVPAGGWQALIRPATFIPEAKTVEAQLRDFQLTRSHIAIVVDEYGGTAGLVTIEDVLEEIVGDIRDEYDREEPPIEVEDGRRFWVSGRVSLEELSGALGHHFERADVTTVGGLIYDIVGRVPRSGEELTVDGFRVVVERVVRRRVERVYFERIEQLAERLA
ncbi:MAG TPA: hemolysin family protein [Gemmatimonadaceae bacterium]|nr:hemolysin family protein [Gemmatimonadaceae bacterium]